MIPRASLLCRRRNPNVETCVDNTAKLWPQASVLALRAAGASQLLKPASTTPRSYGHRHRSWHHDHVHATHNERRRGQRPVQHDQVPCELNASAGSNWAKAHIHKSRARFLLNPLYNVTAFVVNSEPHTGARPSVRWCCGARACSLCSFVIWVSADATRMSTKRNFLISAESCKSVEVESVKCARYLHLNITSCYSCRR